MRSPFSLLISLLLLLRTALGQTILNTNSTRDASVFVYNVTGDGFVFALSANPTNGDLYFHMSAPAGNAWMGVGIGSQMSNALMFIVYPSSNGSGVTISPRIALHGNSEPTYTPSVTCDHVYGLPGANSITSFGYQGLLGDMVADAVCHNATHWLAADTSLQTLDLSNPAQPFIFAVGPGENIDSDALDAPLNRHSFYGQFALDMQQATSHSAAVPPPDSGNSTYILSGSSAAYNTSGDNNLLPAVHAVFMLIAFVIIFPLGSLTLRLLKRVLFHAAVQTLGVIFILIGFATGISISSQYNRSRSYSSAHQILGLLLFSFILIDFGLGLSAHLIFKRTQKHPPMRIMHLILGPSTILLGVVNGGLGFKLALNSAYNTDYIVVVIAVALLVLAVRGTLLCCSSQRKERREDEAALAAAAANPPTRGYYEFDAATNQYVPVYADPASAEEAGKTQTTVTQTSVFPHQLQQQQQAPPTYRESVYAGARYQQQQQQQRRSVHGESYQMQDFSSAQVHQQQQQQQQMYHYPPPPQPHLQS